ncbi:MAG: hypothetical protein QMD53_03260 [Actinomycetota bacterium]|nr:hypothetical protein [Actinomycetota bacterium]
MYEKIFTTKLVRETAKPDGFVVSKDNIQEQLENLLNREIEVVETEKLSFKEITKKLAEADVLTSDEKSDYDNFYMSIRNSVAHGLTLRLFGVDPL